MKWGGMKLGEEKVYTLSYADDMVLIVENKDEMKNMLERLKDYLQSKNLELNSNKKFENNKIQKRGRENGKKRVEMEREKDRESKGI